MSRKRRILVIGGGLAGMSAALRLADHGETVQLVESKRRLGGRVGSYHDGQGDQWVDYCQHVGMECCTELRWLIERLDQRDDWEVQSTLHFFGKEGVYQAVQPLPLPAPYHLVGMLWNWPGLSWGERLRLALGLRRLIGLRQHDLRQLGDLTMEQWLSSIGQSPTIIACFWQPILVSALGDTLARVTLASAYQVMVDGFAASRHAYRLWVPKRPLSYLMNEQAQTALNKAGVDVLLQTPVTQICMEQGRVQGVRVGTEFLAAEQVLLAVPWYVATRMLESIPELSASLPSQRLEASPITGVHTWWDRDWLPQKHAILMDRLCQWVFPGTGQETPAGSTYYQVVISGSRQLEGWDSSQVLQAIEQDLKEIFPSCRQAKLLRGKVVTDRQAVFTNGPGSQAARWRVDQFADRGLWLAGDWTQTGWPATMEGAIRSGGMAAKAMREYATK